MELIICRQSALTLWRALGDYVPRAASSRPNLHFVGPPDIERANLAPLLGYLSPDEPLDVLVGQSKDRRRHPRLKTHLWSLDLPKRSLAKFAPGLQLSSPEFVFLQMARDLAFYDLLKLGFELCGTYALAPDTPRGFISRNTPLTSAEKIIAFVDKCPKAKGAKTARKVARHIIDGSASPMETALAMILCLPHYYGGYAFPRPALNMPMTLELDDGETGRTRTRACRCDLFWSKKALAIEYDSDAEHLSTQKFGEDSIRRNDLVATNIAVITVTKGQVLNLNHWPKLAGHVSAGLGIKLRIRVDNHWSKQQALYANLFGHLFTRYNLYRDDFNPTWV